MFTELVFFRTSTENTGIPLLSSAVAPPMMHRVAREDFPLRKTGTVTQTSIMYQFL